jgi:murein DD-endopeptidase MepM/ murein hydrolase activator NlpD
MMKNWTWIIPAGLVAYWLFKPENHNSNVTVPALPSSGNSPEATPQFAMPADNATIRNDGQGKGHFGASRGSRVHNGLDLLVKENQVIMSPIDGYVKRMAFPYDDDHRWQGVEIIGSGQHAQYAVKIFYFIPYKIGWTVKAGQHIGKAQAISKKYSPAMKDHIHIEVRKGNQLLDPAPFFNLYA